MFGLLPRITCLLKRRKETLQFPWSPVEDFRPQTTDFSWMNQCFFNLFQLYFYDILPSYLYFAHHAFICEGAEQICTSLFFFFVAIAGYCKCNKMFDANAASVDSLLTFKENMYFSDKF